MKKTLSIILVLSMLVCLLPVFGVHADGNECTIVEHKNETVTLFENKAAGWSYAQTAEADKTYDATSPDANWLTQIPADWSVTVKGDLFDNGQLDAIDAGEQNVWNSETYNQLWAVRKVTLTAEEYEAIKDKPLTTYMKHCDNVQVYVNGVQVLSDPRGQGWTNDLTTFAIPYTLADLFRQDTDGSYYGVVAAHVTRVNGPYWFDMNLEVVTQTTNEVFTEITIANADQYLDYVAKEADSAYNLGGNVPVTVTVTGNLDFAGKDYKAIETLNNTTIDFGGYTVSNIHINHTINGNQDAIIAVEATNGTVIKNLKMKNCSITTDREGYDVWVGAVVGWGDGVTVQDITLENVAITDNCDNPDGTLYGGIGAVVGVSDGILTMENITMKNVTLSAPNTTASFAVGRHGVASTDYVDYFTVTGAVVDALRVGTEPLELLSYLHQNTLLEGYDVSIDYTEGTILSATPGEYTAYLQTRPGKTEGTYDYRFIIVASQDFIKKVNAVGNEINFSATFTNGVAGEERSFDLTAGTIYSMVSTTDAAGVTESYYAAASSYVFGWVITSVPEAYASTVGENMPTLTLTTVID